MFSKNEGQLKSTIPQKIGKIILWTLVCFLILRGIGSIIKKDPTGKIQKDVQQSISSVEQKEKLTAEASAFATSFVKEYLTYNNNDIDDYTSRISSYLAKYLQGDEPAIQTNADVQASDVIALSAEFYTDTQINVNVKARVTYKTKVKDPQTNQDTDKLVVKDVYMRVPILAVKGQYVVEDLPTFMGRPATAAAEANQIQTSEADDSIIKNIKDMLNNFFKTYCEGSSSELKYYMLDANAEVTGLNGEFTFKQVEDVKAYEQADKNQYLVIATYTVKDKDSQQEMKQKLNLTVVKKDDRYYIKSFDVRTENLK